MDRGGTTPLFLQAALAPCCPPIHLQHRQSLRRAQEKRRHVSALHSAPPFFASRVESRPRIDYDYDYDYDYETKTRGIRGLSNYGPDRAGVQEISRRSKIPGLVPPKNARASRSDATFGGGNWYRRTEGLGF
jgi:hypothetical protein